MEGFAGYDPRGLARAPAEQKPPGLAPLSWEAWGWRISGGRRSPSLPWVVRPEGPEDAAVRSSCVHTSVCLSVPHVHTCLRTWLGVSACLACVSGVWQRVYPVRPSLPPPPPAKGTKVLP